MQLKNLIARTNKRKQLGFNQTYPEHTHAGKLEVDRRYSILIGKCHVRTNCPYTWVLKFNGAEIERGEENTRELATKDAIDARTSHQTHNQT